MISLNERLISERKRLELTQDDLAAAGGVGKRAQANYEAGVRVPDAAYLAGAASKGLDVLYVVTGRRETAAAPEQSKAQAPALLPPPQLSEPPPKWGGTRSTVERALPLPAGLGAPPVGGSTGGPAGGLLVVAAGRNGPPLRLPVGFDGGAVIREFQVIPKFRAAASAGKTGTPQQDDGTTMAVDAAGVLAMDRAFMRDQLGSDKASFVSVSVKGDSMERTLIDGETIIIDSDVTEVDCNGIYVVQVGKALLVKRLVLQMDGSVLVKSDNAAYSSYDREFTPEQVGDLRVVGRMVWPKFR